MNKNDIFGFSVVVSVEISRDWKFNVREQIALHRIRSKAANRTRVFILAQSDHLARPGQKMLTLLRFDLQDSTMLKNFNICFYHQCIDTLCYIINHNIATGFRTVGRNALSMRNMKFEKKIEYYYFFYGKLSKRRAM